MAFVLTFFDGPPLVTPYPGPREGDPTFRREAFDDRSAAMDRARELSDQPHIAGLALHAADGAVILDPDQMADELCARRF